MEVEFTPAGVGFYSFKITRRLAMPE